MQHASYYVRFCNDEEEIDIPDNDNDKISDIIASWDEPWQISCTSLIIVS